MSDGSHFLISFASATSEGCRQAVRTLDLPHLEKLLSRLAPGPVDGGDEASLSTPQERALARAWGIQAPDGCIPLAAMQVRAAGRIDPGDAWAWITPCHWRVGTDHVSMSHSLQLQLSEADSLAIFEAVLPYFEEDGIALELDTPNRWLARGELFRDLPTASLDRAEGRTIDRWMPRTPKAAGLRRLQQEVQMLLYTHPLSDQWQATGQLPVNSFWVSGTGALPASLAPESVATLKIIDTLRDAALLEDWPAWTALWKQIDVTECARLAAALDKGEAISLTLCGERSAQTWVSPGNGGYLQGLRARMAGLFGGRRAAGALEAL